MSRRPAIGVFCGSSDRFSAAILEAVRTVGDGIGQRGWRLVYGGSQVGLMGIVSRAAMGAGAEVVGVLPRRLIRTERAAGEITELIYVETLAERKQTIADLSDVFVGLPGGIGSIDEIVEMMSWHYIGVQAKPTVILNADGYWQPLFDLFDHLIRNDAVRSNFAATYDVASDVPEMFAMIEDAVAATAASC